MENIYYDIPLEEEGKYIKSFDLTEKFEYVKFFEEFGFVVIRDVLSKEKCDDTINEIWNLVKVKISDADPSNLDSLKNWFGLREEGILPMDPIFTKNILENRLNPNIYKVFSDIMDNKNLLVNHDRVGLFRPTKVEKSELENKYKMYKTTKNIHFDMNPWGFLEQKQNQYSQKCLNAIKYRYSSDFIEENNHCYSIFKNLEKNDLSQLNEDDIKKAARKNLQGLINLKDNLKEDGGFQIVPKFHKKFIKWSLDNKELCEKKYGTSQNFIWLPEYCPLIKEGIRVSAKAGSLVVWSQMCAHGSQPNDSCNFRYAQFVKMFDKSNLSKENLEKRKSMVFNMVKNIEFEKNDLAKQLLDLNFEIQN